jgi:hypothetical protein
VPLLKIKERFCYSGFDLWVKKLPVWEGNAEEISRVCLEMFVKLY